MGSAHIVGDSTASRMLFIRDRVTAAHNLRNCSSLIFAHRNPASCPQLPNPTAQLADSALRAHTAPWKDEDYDVLPIASGPHPRRGFVLRPPELVGDGRSLKLSECPALRHTAAATGPPSESRDYTPPRRHVLRTRKVHGQAGVAQGTNHIFIIVGPGCIRRNPG
jgi:hypothetical protein